MLPFRCVVPDFGGVTLPHLFSHDYHNPKDKLNYLELPIPAARVPVVAGQQVPPETLAAHAAWVKRQKEIVYDSFVQNYNMLDIGKTVNELHAMLKLHEKTLPKQDAPGLHAIRAGKGLRGSRKLKPGALSLYMGNG
ncbi:hypothetical protein Tco_1573726 [Tanacetum coccineum]